MNFKTHDSLPKDIKYKSDQISVSIYQCSGNISIEEHAKLYHENSITRTQTVIKSIGQTTHLLRQKFLEVGVQNGGENLN